jgi:DNA polymerase I
MRNSRLALGADGRNRCGLSAFRSVTGRNQPSNSEFIFGLAKWLRGLVKPEPGMAIAYCDWICQEIGIAAALSGDEALREAYRSGDPYLAFGKKAGLIPADATADSHPNERHLFKACCLGLNYAMGPETLAINTGKGVPQARALIQAHREAYRDFWRWSNAAVDSAMSTGQMSSALGWRLRAGPRVRAGTFRNYPMQANGAEMMRLASCLAIEAGIEVCCPVHDAFLITASIAEIEEKAEAMCSTMRAASREVLSGFEIGADKKVVTYPDRYMDKRGVDFWHRVWALVAAVEAADAGL